mgnify:CR=1 FL=1
MNFEEDSDEEQQNPINTPNKKIQIVPNIYADDSGSELSSDSDDLYIEEVIEEVEFADITIKNTSGAIEYNFRIILLSKDLLKVEYQE